MVAARRKRRGLTQQQLADATGVSRGWLARFETGVPGATLHRVLRVIEALNMEMEVSDAG
ncbi:helix-turn-helix domain-containing protein [Microbacterium gawkjiense]|uniref:helix-turn-helix domain-containing protein n=1 Tax=Microbacterium gawkjiense TaxID=3067309 RepID=UPI003BF55B92